MSAPLPPPTDPVAAKPRWRAPWMVIILVVLLVALPILEVTVLVRVGQEIGVLPTIAILVVEAIIGGWLTKREGTRAWQALQEAFGRGRMPAGELADAALVLVGGLLLMLPGFITDIFGFFFLLPFTRPLARGALGFLIARNVQRTYGVNAATLRTRMDADQNIRGETVDDPDTTDPQRPAQRPGQRPGDDGRTIAGEIE